MKVGDRVRLIGACLFRKEPLGKPAGHIEIETVIRRADGTIKEKEVEKAPVYLGVGKATVKTESKGGEN